MNDLVAPDTITPANWPLSLWLIGRGHEPRKYLVDVHDLGHGGKWSFMDMSLVERAAFRALCEKALQMLDNTGDEEEP